MPKPKKRTSPAPESANGPQVSQEIPAALAPVSLALDANQPPPLRLEWIEAGSLAQNPHNWRRHPDNQLAALSDVLGDPDIGWAGACLFNERTGRLVDGHARQKSVTPQTPIPVLIGSWSEEAEKKILLTLDPLASLATADADALNSLIADVSFDSPSLNDLLSQLMPPTAEGATTTTSIDDDDDDDDEQTPAAAAAPQGDQYKIIITCESEAQQTELLDRFDQEGLDCKALVG